MDESDEEESRADGRVGGSLSVGEKRGVQRGGKGRRGAEFRACSASSPSTAAATATAGC